MIDNWKTKSVSESCKPYAFETSSDYVKIVMWNNFRPMVAQSIIGLKKGLLPFCERNGFVSKDLVRKWGRKNADKVEAKHYEFFKYDFEGLDVYCQMRHDCITVFVLADLKQIHKEKIERINARRLEKGEEPRDEKESESYEDYIAYSHGLSRWGEYSKMWDIIDENPYSLGTNLSVEEFEENCKECLKNTAYFVFDVQFNERQWEIINSDVEPYELQPYLDKILEHIKDNPTTSSYFLTNPYSTKINELPWKDAIDIIPLISNTNETGDLYRYWTDVLFNLHVDFQYTKERDIENTNQ